MDKLAQFAVGVQIILFVFALVMAVLWIVVPFMIISIRNQVWAIREALEDFLEALEVGDKR